MTLRPLEAPLTPEEVAERPSREQWAALTAEAFDKPMPAYTEDDLRRYLRMRWRVG